MRAAQQLADQEKKVQSDVQKLGQSAGDAAAQQQLQQSIAEQKGAMAEGVKDLKSKLDRMALESKRDQRELSRALENAADTLRGRKVEEQLALYAAAVAHRAAGLDEPAEPTDQRGHR